MHQLMELKKNPINIWRDRLNFQFYIKGITKILLRPDKDYLSAVNMGTGDIVGFSEVMMFLQKIPCIDGR